MSNDIQKIENQNGNNAFINNGNQIKAENYIENKNIYQSSEKVFSVTIPYLNAEEIFIIAIKKYLKEYLKDDSIKIEIINYKLCSLNDRKRLNSKLTIKYSDDDELQLLRKIKLEKLKLKKSNTIIHNLAKDYLKTGLFDEKKIVKKLKKNHLFEDKTIKIIASNEIVNYFDNTIILIDKAKKYPLLFDVKEDEINNLKKEIDIIFQQTINYVLKMKMENFYIINNEKLELIRKKEIDMLTFLLKYIKSQYRNVNEGNCEYLTAITNLYIMKPDNNIQLEYKNSIKKYIAV